MYKMFNNAMQDLSESLKKSKVRSIFMSVFFISVFFFSYYIFYMMGVGTGVATLIANAAVASLGYAYMKKTKLVKYSMSPSSIGGFGYIGMFVLLMGIWFFSQITSYYMSVLFNPDVYNTYNSVASENIVVYCVLTVVAAPIGEEIMMRGLVFGMLQKAYPMYVAYIVSSIVFGLVHGTAAHIIVGFMSGLFFCFVYQFTGNIFVNIFFHMLYNLACLVVSNLSIPNFFFQPFVFLAVDVFIIAVVSAWAFYINKLQHSRPRSISDKYVMEYVTHVKGV